MEGWLESYPGVRIWRLIVHLSCHCQNPALSLCVTMLPWCYGDLGMVGGTLRYNRAVTTALPPHRSRAGIKYQQKNDNSGSLDFLLTEDKWKTLTFFGIFEASSILDFTKSRPCLIMHVDSVEKRLCPNTN